MVNNAMRRRQILILALVLCSALPAAGQKYEGRELVQASLVADVTAVVPGQRAAIDQTVLKVRWDDGGP